MDAACVTASVTNGSGRTNRDTQSQSRRDAQGARHAMDDAAGHAWRHIMIPTNALPLAAQGNSSTERRGSDPTELIVNIGAPPKITRQLLLLLAAGRAFRGVPEERPQLLLFAGIQANLPGLYDIEHRRPRIRGAFTAR